VTEERLEGGNVGGAVRVGDTVRRSAGPWTPAVHALLAHLAGRGFTGAPRPLGFDEQGREVLTFLEGESVGYRRPRPAWVHAEDTLDQVARWMRAFHQAVAGFVPPSGAVWRGGGTWSPGLIIAHNDAATYNAAWHQGKLSARASPTPSTRPSPNSPASRDSALSEPVPPGRVRKPDNCHSAHSMTPRVPSGPPIRSVSMQGLRTYLTVRSQDPAEDSGAATSV
jgi:hypothetical protein